ncbi:MBL fold metallo-hydrolase [Aquisalibacillus elongatus]|uniref:Glyoxylase-like metal-dependent hydrolase (Beta-lactamase superfamily II) n=1 Tax=Aquisalibacillus elongatus TaxID=485577 RepID=A0A3N5BEF4_9BACI|nr:MBL fold metallo-hydrolase [Aquisalibacillus elongatus]RPF55279.1 glyoxylase-like metal-dependent hydrolase (beta-lactamase superfamily II) [Aquisalibacillus elongatus]
MAITVKELAQKILNHERVFLLDIRKEEDHNDWSIEGRNVESLNIPYKQLENNVDDVKEKLPNDQEIYVVCARGISSQKATQLIQDQGVENVTYLEGGMTAWSEHLEPMKIGNLSNGGELYQFIRIGKGCLSYMVLANGEAAVIDPVRMTDTFKSLADEKNASIRYVFDSHLHADHISGGRSLADETGADYYFPPKDDEGLTFGYQELEDGTVLRVGDSVEISVFYSPGHTIGSTSFIVDEKFLMTGDILFIESIGRPDLAGKADDWVDDLRQTLYDRYENLPDDLVVLPAHFGQMKEINDDGTIQDRLSSLYQKNERLQVEDEEEFNKLVTKNLPPQPNSHEEIRKTNMGQKNPDSDERREMEVGPNRCAV